MSTLLQDLRYAARTLRQSPGLILVAVLSLGLGIGANTTLFSLFKAIFLTESTAVNPDRIVRLWVGGSNRISYPNYSGLRPVKAFDLAGYTFLPINLRSGEQIERLFGAAVTGNFFEFLGVNAAIGRTFAAEERDPQRNPRVAVLSHGSWQRRFGGDPAAIGRVLNINNNAYTVIGILPPGYHSVFGYGIEPEFYLPLSVELKNGLMDRAYVSSLEMLGRIQNGFTEQQAVTALLSAAKELEQAYPKENLRFAEVRSYPFAGLGRLQNEGFVKPVLAFFAVLLIIVGLVLLIACANVAGLLLARSVNRRREIAVRLALGAPRRRLIQQFLAESAVLAILGTACGVLINVWCTEVLSRIHLPLPEPIPLELHFASDVRLFLYALAVTLATTILCGLMPALQASRPGLTLTLNERSARISVKRLSLRNTLVVGQVAVSLLLLVTSFLFIRSLMHVGSVNPGFEVEHMLNADIDLDEARFHTNAQKLLFFEQALDRVSALPGVQSAASALLVPLSGNQWMSDIEIPGHSGKPLVNMNSVSPAYFQTMGTPVTRGREFRTTDRDGAPLVGVVNQTFASRYFAGQDAVGKHLRVSEAKGRFSDVEIVGIVANSKHVTLGEDPLAMLYYSLPQNIRRFPTLHIRTAGPPASVAEQVHRTLAELDKTAPVRVRTMREDMAFALVPSRIAAVLLGAMGALGLLLATIGLYGVMAFTVNRRVPEIGVRMALGATSRNVLGLVLREGLALVAAGVAIGLALALIVTRPLARFLAGVSTSDPVSLIAVTAILMLVSLAATYFPARRATKVDPMVALRYE